MKNIYVRTIFGALYIGSVICSLLVSEWIYLVLFLFFSIMAFREFLSLGTHDNFHPESITGIISHIFIILLTYFNASGYLESKWLIFSVFPFFAIPLLELFRNKIAPLENVTLGWGTLIYVTLPFALMNYIVFDRTGNFNGIILLAYFIMLWTNDTGAYVFGLSFGKHKLFERISPKKSWEGLFGGLLSTIAAAWILSIYFNELSRTEWLILGVIISTGAILGDLIESMIKRELNLKDSGQFIPGHGGALDRFDSVLFTIPFVYIYLTII